MTLSLPLFIHQRLNLPKHVMPDPVSGAGQPVFSRMSEIRTAALLLALVLVVVSGCAGQLKISPPVASGGMRIAVLPFHNLSGGPAQLQEIRQQLLRSMEKFGMQTIPEAKIEEFLARRRIRYTGGIDSQTAEIMGKELAAEAALITTVELNDGNSPPKFALIARLVATGKDMRILWMDSVGRSGDDAPGLLKIGIIEDPRILREKVVQELTNSLASYFGRAVKADPGPLQGKFAPKVGYQRTLAAGKKYRLAVLPFHNETERKNAGEILMLHLIQQLQQKREMEVIEPGVVRQQLLALRMVMSEGVSLADVDNISDLLEADLILAGRCLQYEDYRGAAGAPQVMFSALMIERQSRKMVWSSASYNGGNDNVLFFNFGKIYTASALASGMTRAVAARMAP